MSGVKKVRFFRVLFLMFGICVLGFIIIVGLQHLDCKEFSQQARPKSTVQNMDLIMTGLFLFKESNGRFPSTEEGISILSESIMSGPYLKGSYEYDGWGTIIRYEIDAQNPWIPILWSAGKDELWNTSDDLRKESNGSEYQSFDIGRKVPVRKRRLKPAESRE